MLEVSLQLILTFSRAIFQISSISFKAMKNSVPFSDYISHHNSRISQTKQKMQNIQANNLQQKYYKLKKQFQQLEKTRVNDVKKFNNMKEFYQIKMQTFINHRLETAKKFKMVNDQIQLLKTQNAYLKSRCELTQTRIDDRKMIFSTKSIDLKTNNKENISKSSNIIEVKKNQKNSQVLSKNQQLQQAEKCYNSECIRIKMDYMELKQQLDQVSLELQKTLEGLIFFITEKWELQELKQFKVELNKKYQVYEKKQFHGAAKSLFILCEIQKKLKEPSIKEQRQASQLFKVQQKLQKIKQKSKQLKNIPFLKGGNYSFSQIGNLCNESKNQLSKLKKCLIYIKK